ncbi:MAG: tRNA pseudouridine(38-40) synthase TruA [Anaerolineales bacterium]|nr:tRNA pseudouridine(38-40) synthase TruA [Anaerolineales bacterium]
MARYQVILAYDGARYQGFQRQAGHSNSPSVQAAIEAALRKLGWSGRSLLAAGRTDAGVHALGQVIAFDLEWAHTLQQLREALNANLPEDIAAREARQVRPDFHPRYDALARRYRYRLFCAEVRHPLEERYAWRVWPAVSVDRMHQAASLLVGVHDFASFGTPPRRGGRTIREVLAAAWKPGAEVWGAACWEFDVLADGFLYRMVRRLVNALVEIGQGKQEVSWMEQLLLTPQPHPIQGLAPAQGLTLVEVLYPPGPGEGLAPAE